MTTAKDIQGAQAVLALAQGNYIQAANNALPFLKPKTAAEQAVYETAQVYLLMANLSAAGPTGALIFGFVMALQTVMAISSGVHASNLIAQSYQNAISQVNTAIQNLEASAATDATQFQDYINQSYSNGAALASLASTMAFPAGVGTKQAFQLLLMAGAAFTGAWIFF